MAPPAYGDLGKNARDLFSKGYTHGFLKLDTTTKTDADLELKTGASHNIATGKLFGNLELKYRIPDYGLTLKEKWNTDNTLGSEITIEDKLAKGSKLIFDSTFSPQQGKRSGKIKGELTGENYKFTSDATLDFGGPLVNFNGVLSYEGWLVGFHSGYDAQKSKLLGTNLAFGRMINNYAIHTFVNENGTEFGGNIFHKVNPRLELGASLGWKTGEQTNTFGVAGKYQLDKDITVRGKITSTSQLGLGITTNLNSNLKLTLSTIVDLQKVQEGGHKCGLGIEYESK